MKLKILSIGKVRDKNILKMRQEFTKQINHDINFESIMIKGSNIQKEG
jgi:23S rRNA pseudoU1915 N3-methylase RlmH